MALFFDRDWFDAKMARAALRRVDVAAALGLSVEQLAEMWKDQREVSAAHVRVLAALLGESPQEIALRAGVSTPIPQEEVRAEREMLADLSERAMQMERTLAEIKALLLDLRLGKPGS